MSNIENLKKQAKQYLRWHRERYYPVAADIRATLPQFSGFSDEEILLASFRLAHAQDSWRDTPVSMDGRRSFQEPTR